MAKVDFKFGDFCRLCLKQAEDLIYLKAMDPDLIQIVDKLQFINTDLVAEDDIFPYWVCLRCNKHLNFAYKFTKKCLKSKTILNECLDQIRKNHYNEIGKLFYITNIRGVQKSDDDPLVLKDEEIQIMEDENSINLEDIQIKSEPEEISIQEEEIQEDEEAFILNLDQKIKVEPAETINFNDIEIESIPMESFQQSLPTPSTIATHPTKKTPNCPEKLIFTCSICDRSFKSENLLTSHLTTHENFYSCALCGKSFKVKEFLARHLESHLNEDEKYYVCDFCGEKFSNVRKLRHHFAEHNRKNKNGKVIPAKELLEKSFKRKIIKDEIVQCNICDEKFNQKRLLIIHMRKHFN